MVRMRQSIIGLPVGRGPAREPYGLDARWVSGEGGVTADGEFRLEDEKGNKVGSQDYDDSGFGGLNLQMHF